MRWIMLCLLLIPLPGFCGGPVLSSGQLLYVPVYSHIYTGDKERPFNLAVTLSIRNTDPSGSLKLTAVDYYDTDGHLVRHYLDAPLVMKPLASIRYVVAEKDVKGGSGANFLVRWEALDAINVPVVESVMIGAQSGQGISFTSQAREIQEHSHD
ncbi:hypothetical protein H4684_002691 [Desulfomicrobium macestii]|uniref:DUF3124 domain-containing protein n=2 Tax=Desulfomicrobium TaxID=898 RepID=A0A8G2C5K5_DESNO|nr:MULTISPECIES: DUF3124 domain-containing protein [Desulfomicrobium]MBE1426032.1 hypothetical protein [Desulfomicrobium macestii]SFM12465.1 Protein of unknown function [Desulfomicrobium norvegicum]